MTRVRDLAPGTEHRDRSVIRLTLAFLSRSLILAVSLPHLISQVYPETIASQIRLFALHLRAARGLRYQCLAMALSLLKQGVARWDARELRTLSSKSQSDKAK